MKRKHLITLLVAMMSVTPLALKAQDNQTTEGTDFWLTFPRSDENDGKTPDPFLAISSMQDNCTIRIEMTGFDTTVVITAADNRYKEVDLAAHYDLCYLSSATDETPVNKAVHVTANSPISLYAGNWPWELKDGRKSSASFDVANIIPVAALRDEYLIQAYPPSDHGGTAQGSHFAIIATEDNTVVDFVVTASTYRMPRSSGGSGPLDPGGSGEDLYNGRGVGDTLTTPVLSKGQVYYVWTGSGDGNAADLTGSWVKARDNKRVAVFNGVPHTNVPSADYRNRDQLFEQAMPVVYWGTNFFFSSSLSRKKDIVAVLAYYDGTTVSINGQVVYTFDFANNPHRCFYYEFGEEGLDSQLQSGMIQTSCPTAVHLITVSDAYDLDKNADGDPSMAWINPIEQVISDITFSTFQEYSHYVNVVTSTANVNSMYLDDNSINTQFQPIPDNESYSLARLSLGTAKAAHRLRGDAGFIAHVYGFGPKEAYSYSVGGSTKPLEQYVSINGQIFTPDSKNVLCGIDTIMFSVDLNYPTDSVVWRFGDGTPDAQGDTVYHLYGADNIYQAQVQIYFTATDLCGGMSALPTRPIDIEVNTQMLDMSVPEQSPQCVDGVAATTAANKASISFEAATGLTPDTACIRFGNAMKGMGFRDSLAIHQDYVTFGVPDTSGVFYADSLIFFTENCGSDTLLHVPFVLSYLIASIAQRWGDVLFLRNASSNPMGYDLEGGEYQWYKNGQAINGATKTYIYSKDLGETSFNASDRYSVAVTKNGVTIPTCDFTPEQYNGDDAVVAVDEVFIHPSDRLTLTSTQNGMANITSSMGVRMLNNVPVVSGTNSIEMPVNTGVYIMNVLTEDGRNHTFKIIVR